MYGYRYSEETKLLWIVYIPLNTEHLLANEKGALEFGHWNVFMSPQLYCFLVDLQNKTVQSKQCEVLDISKKCYTPYIDGNVDNEIRMSDLLQNIITLKLKN